ncbi:MAG: hypothetical protein IJ849_03340 [Selenomonadaceae bacterium]|nr:hypothetical protein [Selenomonadaceae bacterium]
MARIEIPLIKEYQRPIIELYDEWTLIDTGAIVPIISLRPKKIIKEFSGELKKANVQVGGLGGESNGDVYQIPEFKIGENLVYSPFEVFVPHAPFLKFPFLLSATMFYGMNYAINTMDTQFVIETGNMPLKREFKLISLKGGLYPQVDGVLVQDGSIFLVDPGIASTFSLSL